MIEINQISYDLPGKRLLDNISFNIEEGEFLAILGPNGAGKTTLLRTLCGDITQDTGEVKFNGKLLSACKREELAQQRAVVSQFNEVAFPFTVQDIVSFGLYPHNQGRATDHEETLLKDLMILMEIFHLRDRIYNTLSGGEKQRVQLARALLQVMDNHDQKTCRYLFLDEPMSNMDICHQHASLKQLKKYSQSGISVVIILHDINLASLYSDRIAILHNGQLLAIGKPEEVIRQDLIEATYNLPIELIQHPKRQCPIIVPLMAT